MYIDKVEKKQRYLIRGIIKKACYKLNMPYVQVKFNRDNQIYALCANNENERSYIQIDLIKLLVEAQIKNKQSEHLFMHIKPINSIKKRFTFIIFHELAHVYTSVKYKKLFKKGLKEYKEKTRLIMPYADYRRLKLEKYADKIALCLINDNKKGV